MAPVQLKKVCNTWHGGSRRDKLVKGMVGVFVLGGEALSCRGLHRSAPEIVDVLSGLADHSFSPHGVDQILLNTYNAGAHPLLGERTRTRIGFSACLLSDVDCCIEIPDCLG